MTFPLNLTKATDELKKLIDEHPDYPIVVLAGEEASGGGYYWTFCSDISFDIGEVLDCEVPYGGIYGDDSVCCDRDYFEEQMQDWLFDKLQDDGVDVQHMPDAEFDKLLKEEMEKYEPYWKKVIEIWVTN